ncbi:MAG TPA: hypothetical protein VHB49_25255 [Bradyrhizobium sp.]|nr:hypothetical protein [Bradyrhizobium sp.]
MNAKALAAGCVVLSALFSPPAYSRGGMGGGLGGGGLGTHHSSTTGGSFGAAPTAPGTNSAGTALSSGGSAPVGVSLGTGDPAAAREDRKAEQMIHSICRGC